MPTEIKVFAYTFPTICLVLGFLLILYGNSTNNGVMTSSGWTFIVVGVIMQIMWLFRKRLSGD